MHADWGTSQRHAGADHAWTPAHESYRNDNTRDTELAVTIVESNYKE